jgi:hypothetical protein
MFNQVISREDMPHSISTDNDPLFLFHRWQANLMILEVEEVKSIPPLLPYPIPMSNG